MLLHFDPALLAIPNHASTQAEAEQIVHRIRYWARSCFFSTIFQGVILGDTLNILAEENFFPTTPNIVDLLSAWDLRHVYSTEDIRRSINFILERSSILEDVFGVEVTDASVCESIPNLSASVREPSLFDSSVRFLGTLSLALAVSGDKLNASVVVPGFANTIGQVCLKVTANEGVALEYDEQFTFPLSICATLIFADTVDDIGNNLGAKALWDVSKNSEQLHFALMVEAVNLLRIKGLPDHPDDIRKFSIGSDFFQSASRYDATGLSGTNCDLLREACARIVINDPKYEVSELKRRNNVGKLVPIARRGDGATAHRTHLQKSHAALRLMFWRLKDGSIEFANIGPKSELEILDGNGNSAERNSCWIGDI